MADLDSRPEEETVLETDGQQVGRGMRVLLACPHCERGGWVAWERLQSVMRCPACEQRFRLGPDGRFQSFTMPARLRYRCPRCRHSADLAASQALSGTECAACGLTLYAGPGRKVYDAAELAAAQRKAREQSWAAQMRKRAARPFLRKGRMHWPMVGLAAASLAALCGLAALLMYTGPPTLERSVVEFTQACLADDDSTMEHYVGEDDHQRMEFARFKIMHFASIRDAFRPVGDKARVSAKPLEPNSRVVQVTISSEFLGARTHEQYWRAKDGAWKFDAVGTLAKKPSPSEVAQQSIADE